MNIQFGSSGTLAKVTALTDGGRNVIFDLRTGSTSSFNHDGLEEFQVGDVLLLTGDDNGNKRTATKMPREAWPEALWVGIVKIKLPDLTVIDSGARFRPVPTVDTVNYEVGNTVQAGDVVGVTRVISDKPIKYIDLPEVDDTVIDKFRANVTGESGPSFEDFGGLQSVVDRARELIELNLQRKDQLSAIGARPTKGILFTGKPGTGKTMLAKIIASVTNAAFYEISGPEIFSKWYGQSEEVLRKLFDAAGSHDKAIIFFDEIDSVAAQRGDESHEASKRVVAQLLTLMDGFTPSGNVIVIAATNRPQDLDVALRRPGRFDVEIEFPYPNERDREDILRKTARKLCTNGPLPHGDVAKRSEGWSAADLAQIWSEAALLAVGDSRLEIREEDYLGGFERVFRNRMRSRET